MNMRIILMAGGNVLTCTSCNPRLDFVTLAPGMQCESHTLGKRAGSSFLKQARHSVFTKLQQHLNFVIIPTNLLRS